MKIKTRLQIITIFSVAIALAIGLVLFLTSQRVNKEISSLKIADEIAKGVFELNIITYEYLLHREERMQTQWQLRHDSLTKWLTGEEFKGPERRLILDRMGQDLESLKAFFTQLVENYKRRGNNRKESALSRELEERLVGRLLVKSQAMVSDASQLAEASRAEVAIDQQRSGLLVMVFIAIMAVMIAAVSFMFGRSVVKPIRKLHEGTEIIGAGNLDYRVGTAAKDEIGQLSRAFDEMIGKRKQAEEALRRSEEEAKQLAQENAIMAEIGRIVSSTLNIDEVYESFSKEVKKVIPFDRIVIDIIDNEKGTVKNVYIAGEEVQDRDVKVVYALEGSGNAEMVRTKSTFLIQGEDFNEFKDRFPMLLSTFQAGFRSIMNVPLFSKGNIIGGLLLRSRKPYAYTDNDVKLAERISSQVAGAVANAQLYAERIRAEMERADLEEQLRQSQKMEAIGQLAGGVAHDFNNLLTIIKGYSQLSMMELKEGTPLKGNIDEIQKAAERAAGLTRQILAFSRRQIMEMKVLDLNVILRDLDKMLHRIVGEDIELVTLLAKNLGRVKTDPGQIEQVIMNLAVNAKDAMPNGGKLTIETANAEMDEEYARTHVGVTPGHYVMFSVSDTGVGMTPQVKERIFEPFFTTKGAGKGTGLGLSVIYGIVKQHEGWINVFSEPGKGSKFEVYLPASSGTAEEVIKKEVTSGQDFQGKGERILLVEDDPKIREFANKILRKTGYEVLEASNLQDAVDIFEKENGDFALVFSDVVLPDRSGLQLAEELLLRKPTLKVLLTSGYTGQKSQWSVIREKGYRYIQKPYNLIDLLRVVREVIES